MYAQVIELIAIMWWHGYW